MNRRRFVAGLALLAGGLGTGVVLAKPEPEVTPVAVPTLGATPGDAIPPYTGPITDLWNQPWRTEGKAVVLKGIILSTTVAPPGQGLRVGADDTPYRALIVLQIPNAPGRGQVLVATNDDLRQLRDLHTAQVTAVYAGEHNLEENGGYWSVPLLIAVSIDTVPV